MSYRIRGSFARMVYNRMLEDMNNQSYDHSEVCYLAIKLIA